MVVRAVKGSGTRLNIRPAVSEEFVVVTKRTKNLKKQEIPSLDDPISKLNHIGKETVKKLNEIKASADEMNLDLKLPRELWRYSWPSSSFWPLFAFYAVSTATGIAPRQDV